jgi:hypothetical protein
MSVRGKERRQRRAVIDGKQAVTPSPARVAHGLVCVADRFELRGGSIRWVFPHAQQISGPDLFIGRILAMPSAGRGPCSSLPVYRVLVRPR